MQPYYYQAIEAICNEGKLMTQIYKQNDGPIPNQLVITTTDTGILKEEAITISCHTSVMWVATPAGAFFRALGNLYELTDWHELPTGIKVKLIYSNYNRYPADDKRNFELIFEKTPTGLKLIEFK